jgi:hypothetical protein
MIITTEEAELHRHQIEEVRLLRLAAERDTLRAERNAERNARFKSEAEFSHMQRRIARQRRALAKLYKKRRDRKAERDYLEKTALQAAQCHGRETLRADGLQAENARLRGLLSECNIWLTAAIECKDWMWDGDQKEAAIFARDQARAALGEKE